MIFCKLIVGAGLIIAVLLPMPVLARPTNASFYLTASASSVMVGDTFIVNIYESGQDITAAQANLFYDPAKLECVAVGDGAFAVDIASYCSNGIATLGRTVGSEQAGLNGPQIVGSLTFNVNGSARKTTIGFSTANVESGGVVMPASTASSSYELINPAPADTPIYYNDIQTPRYSYYNTENIGVTFTYGPKVDTSKKVKDTIAATTVPGKANPIVSAVLSDKIIGNTAAASTKNPTYNYGTYFIQNSISLLCILFASSILYTQFWQAPKKLLK